MGKKGELPKDKRYLQSALDKAIVVDEEEKIISGIVGSTGTIDRHGESINPEGWKTENYMKNPVIMFGHDYWSLPIGKALRVWVEDGKLKFNVKFSSKPFAQDVFDLIKDGFLNAVSVGFIPLKWDEKGDFTFAEQELLELSVVPVPANPDALISNSVGEKVSVQKHIEGIISRMAEIVSKKDIKPKKEDELPTDAEAKGVVSYDATEKAPEDTEWDGAKARKQLAKFASSDGSGDKDKIDWGKYAKGFTWFDDENKEKFGSYKLPHHYADGGLKVVWNGCRAAMGACLGARGGVNMSDEDRKGAYNHLAKHYKQFDKEVPEFKEYTPEELFDMDAKGIIDIGDKVEVSKELFSELIAQSKELAEMKENSEEAQRAKEEKLLDALKTLRKIIRPSNANLNHALRELNSFLKPSSDKKGGKGGETG